MNKRISLLSLCFLFSYFTIIAQNQSNLKKIFIEGNDFFTKGNYQKAYKSFKESQMSSASLINLNAISKLSIFW